MRTAGAGTSRDLRVVDPLQPGQSALNRFQPPPSSPGIERPTSPALIDIFAAWNSRYQLILSVCPVLCEETVNVPGRHSSAFLPLPCHGDTQTFVIYITSRNGALDSHHY
ncbi:hypothetical protein DTO271G3_6809 [Paecilomyces variotii]|nr:hypothetical protein DTO271G3_6809 [Paecilomyces variotii]